MIDFSLLESDNEKIEFIQSIGNLIINGEITPQSLNNGLGNYFNANTFLLTLYETSDIDYKSLKEDYEVWFSEKFIEVRDSLNKDRTTSKYASQSEINNQVIVDNKSEYSHWKSKLLVAEKRVSFYRRLVDSFKTQSQILITLSNNMRSEMWALQVDKGVTKEAITKRVKIKKEV